MAKKDLDAKIDSKIEVELLVELFWTPQSILSQSRFHLADSKN